MPPAKFIERLRVERARLIIEDTGLSMAEIARKSGFDSEQRMRRAFKRVLGINPADHADRVRPPPPMKRILLLADDGAALSRCGSLQALTDGVAPPSELAFFDCYMSFKSDHRTPRFLTTGRDIAKAKAPSPCASKEKHHGWLVQIPDTERYAHAIKASKATQWDIDRDVIKGRAFDLGRKYLPDGLCLAQEFTSLSDAERRLVSQIQGRTYANVFGLVERFITAKLLEIGRDYWLGDQNALEALVRFSDEELKHQALFRRIEAMMAGVMPAGYSFDVRSRRRGACRAQQEHLGRPGADFAHRALRSEPLPPEHRARR
jgi:hypothetical protein